MRTRLVREQMRRDAARMVERVEGRLPTVLGFVAGRAANILIPDVSKLPVEFSDTTLQRSSDGKFYFMPDYSRPDGDDILR